MSRRVPDDPSESVSRLQYVLMAGLSFHGTACPAEVKRPRRSNRSERPVYDSDSAVPALSTVETDATSRVVYVNLEPCSGDDALEGAQLRELRASLVEAQPSDGQLARLTPINPASRGAV